MRTRTVLSDGLQKGSFFSAWSPIPHPGPYSSLERFPTQTPDTSTHNQPNPQSPNHGRSFSLTGSSGRCCLVATFSRLVECDRSVPSPPPPPRSTCSQVHPDPFCYSSVQYSLLRHDYVYLAALDNLHIESGCPPDLLGWGCRDGAVVRALASHQCGPGSILGLGVICGLSLLVLCSAPRGFLQVLRFPLSSKTNI